MTNSMSLFQHPGLLDVYLFGAAGTACSQGRNCLVELGNLAHFCLRKPKKIQIKEAGCFTNSSLGISTSELFPPTVNIHLQLLLYYFCKGQ